MGIINYLLKNCILRTSIYIITYIAITSLMFLDYTNIETISEETLSEFIFSNSISNNIDLIYESFSLGFKNKFILILFFLGLIYINTYSIFKAIIYRREINITYALSLHQNTKNYWWQKEKIKISHDKFIKLYINTIYYENSVSIDISKYENAKEEIIQYLKLSKDHEIDIKRYKTKGVQLHFYKLRKLITFNTNVLEKGKIFYGYSKDGEYALDFKSQTSMIVAGESGSGKSTLLNLLITSILFNINLFEKIYLIDLKGVELTRYSMLEKFSFVKEAKDVLDVVTELNKLMKERYAYMIEKELIKYEGEYIYCIIDEIGTINTQSDKKLKEAIFSNMIELFQKGRAAKIIFLIFSQKIDSLNIPSNVLTNIQSSVLMRTDSDFNIHNTIGTKEQVEKITKIDPDSFPFGRAIIKNGVTSEKTLIQIPNIKYNDYKQIL